MNTKFPAMAKPADYQTDCDIEFENQCRIARMAFLVQLSAYSDYTKTFFKAQTEDADSLWKASVRFNILRDSCPRGIYPKDITDQVMCEMLQAKDKIYKKMSSALLDWLSGDSFTQLRQIYIEFQRSTRPVKWSYPSALICGSSKEKPLKFYVDSALDVMYYYERLHRHVEKTFSAITLVDSDSMAAYTKTLTYSEQFEQLLADLLLYGSVLTANVFSIDEKSRKI